MCGALKRRGSELRRWVRGDAEVGEEAVEVEIGFEDSEGVWDELVGEGARWVLS